MIGRKDKKQQLAIPFWVIGLCGIFAGGLVALDRPANAKNPGAEPPVATKASVEATAADAAVASPPQAKPSDSTHAPGEKLATSESGAAVPPGESGEKIVYRDTPRDNRAAGLNMKNILALLLLASVAGGAMYYAKRKQKVAGPLKQSRTMSLVDTLRLGGRYSISLVHVPGRLLVIGSSEKGMNLLTEMTEQEVLSGEASQAGSNQPAPPQPSNDHGLVRDENDEFFNHLMHRISQAGEPPMSEPETVGVPGPSNLRNRLQQYQFGPSNA